MALNSQFYRQKAHFKTKYFTKKYSTLHYFVDRFPDDFMFELTKKEHESLRSQFVTLKRGQHSKYPPFAFTEQGVAMLSSVLNSDRAINVNIAIMRAFTRLRKMLATHEDLKRKIDAIASRSGEPSVFSAANEKNKPTLRTLLAQWNCVALIPSGCALWFVICDNSEFHIPNSEIDSFRIPL